MRLARRLTGKTLLLVFVCCAAAAGAEEGVSAQVEFFEAKIRPLLVNHCYSCHSAKAPSAFAGLRLDSREAILEGGQSGPAIVPGKPQESHLIQRIQGRPVLMPPTGRLKDDEIAAFIEWVVMGAPWPQEEVIPAGKVELGFNLEERKRNHWAWQPVRPSDPPPAPTHQRPRQPVDSFVLAQLEERDLEPAAPADRYTLIRRLSFDLRGLPPSVEEIRSFVNDSSPDAYESLIDRFLDSPHFGERWARYWMDLVRYSESHGSEGDPDLPEAWRYRDYLIRAFNNDVPYDQIVREHLAGDLLPNPRIDKKDGINESVIATAHLRMVEHAFQPVEPWEDRVKWVDNQIDVLSKTFQGMTVSCARCHDHKFDAISQKDFYALFGTLSGARPTQRAIDAPELLNKNREELRQLKGSIRDKLAETWLGQAPALRDELVAAASDASAPEESAHPGSGSSKPVKEKAKGQSALASILNQAFEKAACDQASPLYAWLQLEEKQGSEFEAGWQALREHWQSEIHERKNINKEKLANTWDLTGPSYAGWIGHGTGFPREPSAPGEFRVLDEGKRVLEGIYPSGVYTHLLSTKHNGVIQSPRFKIDTDYISMRVLGGDLSFAQLIIENYAVPRGEIYNMRHSPKQDEMTWVQWDTAYWKGFTAYVEFATRDDVTRFQYDEEDSKTRPEPNKEGRSFIGASHVVFHNSKYTPRETVVPILYLLEAGTPHSPEALADQIGAGLRTAIEAWRDNDLTEEQASFLDYFVRHDLLPRSLDRLASVEPLAARYRELEKEVPVARRAPGVLEEGSPPQPLLVRGDHKNPGEPVPRRFLVALEGPVYDDPGTVRLRLAEEVASADNPLTARVAVNRIWHHLFGYGLVRTVDNFGKLGEPPTHPELLDYLADKFVKGGWSTKEIIRLLAATETYRMSSEASPAAQQVDPTNKFLQHANLRRLDAEAIRDSMLAVSGRLDRSLFGPSINVYHSHAKSENKSAKDNGPVDGDGRRSIYQEIRRNAHNPFLDVFDLPTPASTRGQRDATNLPAQSLTLLNSPFVIGQAAEWGKRLAEGEAHSMDTRIEYMFLKALGRSPSPRERDRAVNYLAVLTARHGAKPGGVLGDALVWQDFAHAMFNLKEFIYTQ